MNHGALVGRGYGKLVFALLLPIALMVAFLPAQAHAWIGPIKDPEPAIQTEENGSALKIWNDYITFECDTRYGLAFRTVPTKYYSGTLDQAINQISYQEIQFTVKYDGEEEKELVPGSLIGTIEGDKAVFYLDFANTKIDAVLSFSLMQATNGKFNGDATFPISLQGYENDLAGELDNNGQTWMGDPLAWHT